MLKADKRMVATALESLGFSVVYHSGVLKTSIRDERTPSCVINNNGSLHDFGSGWHGDLAQLLVDFRGYAISDALKKAKELLNLPIKNDFHNFKDSKVLTIDEPINEKFIDNFLLERKQNFQEFSKLLKFALPSLDTKTRNEMAKKYQIGYSKKANRLIMPVRDEFKKAQNLWKYNNALNPKCTFTKNRKRIPFNLKDLMNYKNSDEYILLCEGEKDVLNALGCGYKAVTLGSATSKIDNYLNLFKDLKILIVYDYDEPGIKSANLIAKELKEITKKVKILDWEAFFSLRKLDLRVLKQGFDLTDYLCLKAKNENKKIH